MLAWGGMAMILLAAAATRHGCGGGGSGSYREQRTGVWQPSALETFDIYLRGRLLPAFGKLKLDTVDDARFGVVRLGSSYKVWLGA